MFHRRCRELQIRHNPDGDTAINNFQARRRKLDQYGRDYEIRSLCKAVGEGCARVAPQQFAGGAVNV